MSAVMIVFELVVVFVVVEQSPLQWLLQRVVVQKIAVPTNKLLVSFLQVQCPGKAQFLPESVAHEQLV